VPERPIPLSALDLATVGSGQSSRDALLATARLAQAADRLGYRRYWVAEHHNFPGVASTSPPVLIAHLATATTSIRLGSGGVMLPNHAPLVVAEQFALLEALHPGRIDLGIGRAPGTDQRTAAALRRSAGSGELQEFAGDIVDVQALMAAPADDQHAFAATPNPTSVPEVWVLGSSDSSAVVAAGLGLPYAFANHFSSANTMSAVRLYRERFAPSPSLAEPFVLVTAATIVGDTDEQARRLALPSALSWAEIRRGVRRPMRSLAEAEAHDWTPHDRALAEERMRTSVVGSPQTVHAALTELAARTGADELMIAVQAHDVQTRIRTLELVAQEWAREPVRSS